MKMQLFLYPLFQQRDWRGTGARLAQTTPHCASAAVPIRVFDSYMGIPARLAQIVDCRSTSASRRISRAA